MKFFQNSHGSFSLKQKSELSENGMFDSSLFSHTFIWRDETALLMILAKN